MKTWIDFDHAPIVAIPLTDELDGCRVYQGMLVEGPQGWGEFSAPRDCDDVRAARWLTAAIEVGTVGWPDPVRGRIPVSVSVPAVDPMRARQIVAESGCQSAAVRVNGSPADDAVRLEAVRDALGPSGAIRAVAHGGWDVDAATSAVTALDRAAGGLEFVVQPCATLGEIALLRRRIDVPVAVEQALRDAQDPLARDLAGSADIVVLRVGAMGGVRRAMRVADESGLPGVVAAAPQSTIGLCGALALAAVLPETGFACEVAATLMDGDVVSEGRSLRPVDGRLPVAPMPPGPDPVALERFAITDPAVVTWWRDRMRAVQQHI
ncbi:MAG TPA: enolase C-terminal domain-like protein [Mycobacterium sp.]|uniref:enolase C-terminal domain-like protein n=1 Tax=Mycolicibacterium sp. TaxID=2320850 RepID=UPI0025E05B87|nr:enolase C-terminal domain-like protein [Mycolicibacterium sp.]HPX37775.1 enolase C-terminal domain-like protein [Mycobacterium sp.]HQC77788.1 enolase C-terminal domain-like protein [Mycobacterium sp.]